MESNRIGRIRVFIYSNWRKINFKNEKKIKSVRCGFHRGHWVQLLRIAKALEKEFDVVYMSTHEKCATMVEGRVYYSMNDFSRWDFYKMFLSFTFYLHYLQRKAFYSNNNRSSPWISVSVCGKICGIRTVWIDSIANVEHISFSGRIASKFASRIYTQWPSLAGNKVIFAGNIFG